MCLKSDGARADTLLLIQTKQNTVITGLLGGFTKISRFTSIYCTSLSRWPLSGRRKPMCFAQELIWDRVNSPAINESDDVDNSAERLSISIINYWTKFSYTYTPPITLPAPRSSTYLRPTL